MKVLIGAAAATVLMVAAAVAQPTTTPPTTTTATTAVVAPPIDPATLPPSKCPAIPEAPTLPDGATANQAAMQMGTTTYNNWATQMQTVIACRATEVRELEATVRVRAAEHNAGAATARSTLSAWEAEITEFNARPARSRNSSRN